MPETTFRGEQQNDGPRQASFTPSYLGVLAMITEAGMTQIEVAKVVNASPRTVQNWASGANTPRGKNAERLLDLHTIIDVLRDSYTPEGIQIWLRSRNRNLEMQRPIDLLLGGDVNVVLAEARWVAGGM